MLMHPSLHLNFHLVQFSLDCLAFVSYSLSVQSDLTLNCHSQGSPWVVWSSSMNLDLTVYFPLPSVPLGISSTLVVNSIGSACGRNEPIICLAVSTLTPILYTT